MLRAQHRTSPTTLDLTRLSHTTTLYSCLRNVNIFRDCPTTHAYRANEVPIVVINRQSSTKDHRSAVCLLDREDVPARLAALFQRV